MEFEHRNRPYCWLCYHNHCHSHLGIYSRRKSCLFTPINEQPQRLGQLFIHPILLGWLFRCGLLSSNLLPERPECEPYSVWCTKSAFDHLCVDSPIGSGGFITKTGIATPLMVVDGVLATIAAGLLYTLDIETTTGKWVGYQIFAGFGWGLSFMTPITTTQALVNPSDIASATAIVLCKFLPTSLSSIEISNKNLRFSKSWWRNLCLGCTSRICQQAYFQTGHECT